MFRSDEEQHGVVELIQTFFLTLFEVGRVGDTDDEETSDVRVVEEGFLEVVNEVIQFNRAVVAIVDADLQDDVYPGGSMTWCEGTQGIDEMTEAGAGHAEDFDAVWNRSGLSEVGVCNEDEVFAAQAGQGPFIFVAFEDVHPGVSCLVLVPQTVAFCLPLCGCGRRTSVGALVLCSGRWAVGNQDDVIIC